MNIEARIKRNKLDELAGKFYQNSNSDFITNLQQKGFTALVGIKRKDGIYTVIGENCTFFCSKSGEERQISHQDFLEILKKNALKLGKSEEFDFLEIKKDCFIWILNIQTMNAIWNTILLLHK